jgi:hypothetical protein
MLFAVSGRVVGVAVTCVAGFGDGEGAVAVGDGVTVDGVLGGCDAGMGSEVGGVGSAATAVAVGCTATRRPPKK